ncbi:MAG: hypothetical protein ACETWG_01605 [Candidatus Neomarinimicrobiota bacterium]
MLRSILLFSAFLAAVPLKPQQHVIEIPSQPIKLQSPASFYVSAVVDARTQQDDIGFAQVGLFNKKVRVQVQDGLQPAIEGLLKASFGEDTSLVPVIVQIAELEVGEQTTLTAEVALARTRLVFFEDRDSLVAKVYEAEETAKSSGLDVTAHHPRNIRKALTGCLNQFNAAPWLTTERVLETREVLYASPAAAEEPPSVSKKAPLVPESDHMATLSGWYGTYGNGFVLNCYIYRKKLQPGTTNMVPSFTLTNLDVVSPDGKYSGRMISFGFGSTMFRPMQLEEVVLLMDIDILTGNETIDYGDYKKTAFYFGALLNPGVVYLSPADVGPVIGVGVFASFLVNSKLYPYDLGIAGRIGLKF